MRRYTSHSEYLQSLQQNDPRYYSDFKSSRINQARTPLSERAPFGVRMKLQGEYVVYDNKGWPVIEEQTGEPLCREAAEYICKAFNTLYSMDLLDAGDKPKDTDPYPAHLAPRTKAKGVFP